MDEYFEYLIERAQYYERFEFFRNNGPKVHAGLNINEHLHKEVIIVELILEREQEKNDQESN